MNTSEMASKIKIKILTLLMIMVCTETHGGANEWTDPSTVGMLNQEFLVNFMIALGIDASEWGRTNVPSRPTYTMPLAYAIGNGAMTYAFPSSGTTGNNTTTSFQQNTPGGILGLLNNVQRTLGSVPPPAIPAALATPTTPGTKPKASPTIAYNLDAANTSINKNNLALGDASSGLVQSVNTTNSLLTDNNYGLSAINTGVVKANNNIGTPVAVSGSAGPTLFQNQAEIAANSSTTNTTLGNGTYGLEAINSAVNTTNNRIGKAVAVSGSAGPTLFQNQVGIVKDITSTFTADNDDIASSIVLAQNAITGAETGTALGSLGTLGQSIAGSTAVTKSNITASQNTVTGSSIETELGSLGATGQSIAMSTAATGDNITAGTAATGDNIATLQNVVTGSPIATPLGSLGGMGQSIADLTAATAADITAAQNTMTGSPSTTLLGSLDGMGQSIAGSTAVTKSNITASQNTMTGSPSTTLLGSLDGMGQSIAMSTAATANNTESALMLVQSAITGAEPRTALGSLGTTGQSVSGSTIATAGTLATAQNNLQGPSGATLSAIVTSIGDPTVATAPGTSGATIQGTQTAMASAGAVAAKKVGASLTKIEKNTEKTARNIASIKKGGSTSGNPKGPVNKGTSVANNKTIKRK
jgi:hypothetical protein